MIRVEDRKGDKERGTTPCLTQFPEKSLAVCHCHPDLKPSLTQASNTEWSDEGTHFSKLCTFKILPWGLVGQSVQHLTQRYQLLCNCDEIYYTHPHSPDKEPFLFWWTHDFSSGTILRSKNIKFLHDTKRSPKNTQILGIHQTLQLRLLTGLLTKYSTLKHISSIIV